MFTGIIEATGRVANIKSQQHLSTLTIQSDLFKDEIIIGESIAIDGVCLTVTNVSGDQVDFDVMKESLDKTLLGQLKVDTAVNLERALKVGDRLGGHFVSGHVDTMVTLQNIVRLENYVEFRLDNPEALRKFIAAKGSVTLNGVSLTVGVSDKKYFSVYLIPHTLTVTNLGHLAVGDKLNLEVDLIARYILNADVF